MIGKPAAAMGLPAVAMDNPIWVNSNQEWRPGEHTNNTDLGCEEPGVQEPPTAITFVTFSKPVWTAFGRDTLTTRSQVGSTSFGLKSCTFGQQVIGI